MAKIKVVRKNFTQAVTESESGRLVHKIFSIH